MVRTQIYLPKQLHTDLQWTAIRKRESVAALVRAFVQEGIERDRKKKGGSAAVLLKLAGKGDPNAPRDLSRNLVSYLYGKKSLNYGRKAKR
jgi:hypothetical protein